MLSPVFTHVKRTKVKVIVFLVFFAIEFTLHMQKQNKQKYPQNQHNTTTQQTFSGYITS